jgi:inner membrane protein
VFAKKSTRRSRHRYAVDVAEASERSTFIPAKRSVMQPGADRPPASAGPRKVRRVLQPQQPIGSRRALRRRTLAAALAPFSIIVLDSWRRRQTRCPLIVHGILDESAHLLTGRLVVESLFSQRSSAFRAAVLASSVLIDVDHVPAYTGHGWLDRGVPRPYPHSLTTLATIAAFVRTTPADNDVALGVLVGTALHLWRDVSEPGTGIPLLWPVSNRPFNIGYSSYAAALSALGVQTAVRLSLAGRRASRSRPSEHPESRRRA